MHWGGMPSVTFSPVDVDLVRGAPIGRRRYLDVVLATTSKRYLAALQSYRGALIRRNAALRGLARRHAVTQAALEAALVAWEPLLAEAGATLWAERAQWAHEWAGELADVCAAIGERDRVQVTYSRAIAREKGERRKEKGDTEVRNVGELREALAAALAASREGDLRHGATRVGPHRDDLALSLGGRELRVYGSAGQQRTTAIGFRILEATTLRSGDGSAPVLLFDDPFAELDVGRCGRSWTCSPGPRGDVARAGSIAGQVILAVPKAADIPVGLTRLARADPGRRCARMSLLVRRPANGGRTKPGAGRGDRGVSAAVGLAERVSQAGVIPEWPQLVGPQVAAVTQPLCVTADGTLFVAVATNPWMAELSLMERQLLAAINVVPGRTPVKKIRWQARG